MAERDEIYKQLFASELDYRIIQERLTALELVADKTPWHLTAIADCQAKLAHDRLVASAWIDRLAAIENRTRNGIRARLTSVQALVDARASVLQMLKADRTSQALKVSEGAIRDPDEARDVPEYKALVLARDIDTLKVQRRAAHLSLAGSVVDSLLAESSTWSTP